jgi:hypothetical protein
MQDHLTHEPKPTTGATTVLDAFEFLWAGEQASVAAYRRAVEDPHSEPVRAGLETLRRRHVHAEETMRAALGRDGAGGGEGSRRAPGASREAPPRVAAWARGPTPAPDLASLLRSMRSSEARWTRVMQFLLGDPGLDADQRTLVHAVLLPAQRAHEAVLDRLLGSA